MEDKTSAETLPTAPSTATPTAGTTLATPAPTTGTTKIPYAQFPRDAPSRLEDHIITIVCGNSHMHWCLHLGFKDSFTPILFWNTSHEDSEDDQDDQDGDEEDEEDTLNTLEVHIAPQAHALIFGGEDSLGCIANVSATAAKRKAPVISVYLISSNPEQEDKLLRMFKHVPSRIFKLKNTDFFSAEEGLYPTMGVDRCAVLFAARDMYGAPVLTIDGGTAMTYSALDRSGSIIGGGISPGCRLRFQTLHEKTGALPLIDHRKLKRAVENAILSKKPFPFFAKDTEVGIMTSLCSELAGQLRNIVKQFVAAIQTNNAQQSTKETGIESTTLVAGAEDTAKDDSGKEANGPVSDTPAGEVASENDEQKEKKNLKIVLTGGDADLFQKLLKNDASTIVELEPDVSHLPSNIDFHLNRNLAHYGISERLKDICLDRPVTSEEEFRLKMVGLRVAEVAIEEGEYLRGTVLSFTNTAAVDDCTFEVRLDYNGKTQLWPLQKLYDGMVLYDEVGEKPFSKMEKSSSEGEGKKSCIENDVDDQNWVLEKQEKSKEVQRELISKSVTVRERKLELDPHIEKGELSKFLGRRKRTNDSMSNKRRKKQRRIVEDPEVFLGRRIAKLFPIEDPNDSTNMIEQVFFGTIKYISDEKKIWFYIKYDDGDSEEFSLNEIEKAMELYEEHKHEDSELNRTEVTEDAIENANGGKTGVELDGDKKQAAVASSISEHKEEIE